MSEVRLANRLKHHRERLALSQQVLADIVGVSRQAVVAIEGGRQVPSTTLGLRLAHALRVGVEELFTLGTDEGLTAWLAPLEPEVGAPRAPRASATGPRVAVGEVNGRWVAHRLPPDPALVADGIVAREISAQSALVLPWAEADQLRRNVIVSGCAPILGALTQRVGRRSADARATWLPATSSRSLALLEAGLVHVAGVHFTHAASGGDNVDAVRRAFPGRRMLVVNLTRWRQGFVVPAGNPLDIRDAAALLRPGLKLALREQGAAAHELLTGLLAREGAGRAVVGGPSAAGHVEVAQLVRCGAADVGVAVEGVALAAGLGFVPLTEERFDLVVPAAAAASPPISRLIEALDDARFRAEISHLPGYDGEMSGHVTTVEAA